MSANPFTGELKKLCDQVNQCTLCKLHTVRKSPVFGEGNPNADLMFVGEGPGRNEDEQGRPFVGRSGELLTRIITLGMGIAREDVFICNIAKCRPTKDLAGTTDRAPDPEEMAACTPYLLKQIELIKPKVIITLGSPAAKFLLNTKVGITRLRGQWGKYHNIPVMPTYHPSYVLRNGGDKSPLKKDVWQDIKLVMEFLQWPIPKKTK